MIASVAEPGKFADLVAGYLDIGTPERQSLLEAVYRKTGKPEPLRILKSFSTQQQSTLSALLPALPTDVRGIGFHAGAPYCDSRR